jgi:hypothetical protein
LPCSLGTCGLGGFPAASFTLIRRTTHPDQVDDIVRVTWAIEEQEAKAAEDAQAAEMQKLLSAPARRRLRAA